MDCGAARHWIVAVPVPLVALRISSQDVLLDDAVHAHSALVLSVTWPILPLGDRLTPLSLSEYGQLGAGGGGAGPEPITCAAMREKSTFATTRNCDRCGLEAICG